MQTKRTRIVYKCNIKNTCANILNLIKNLKKLKKKLKEKNYNIFCYIDKIKNKIALTKKHNLGFLDNFYLPPIKESQTITK